MLLWEMFENEDRRTIFAQCLPLEEIVSLYHQQPLWAQGELTRVFNGLLLTHYGGNIHFASVLPRWTSMTRCTSYEDCAIWVEVTKRSLAEEALVVLIFVILPHELTNIPEKTARALEELPDSTEGWIMRRFHHRVRDAIQGSLTIPRPWIEGSL